MIQPGTKLSVCDNSGIKIVKCLKVYNHTNIGSIGDKILVSVRKIKRNKIKKISNLINKKFLYKALITYTKIGKLNWDGTRVRFNKNIVVLLHRTKETLIGTRILVPLLREFRSKKYLKILLLSFKII